MNEKKIYFLYYNKNKYKNKKKVLKLNSYLLFYFFKYNFTKKK